MPKQSVSQYAVLGLLRLKPMSGYGIKRFLDQLNPAVWAESYGNLYPLLKRLEGERLVQCRSRMRGRLGRKEYSLTPQGRSVLQRWLALPPPPAKVKDELLLKLFFGKGVPVRITLGHVRKRLEEMQARRKLIGVHRRRTGNQPLLSHLILLYGEGGTEARIRWCQEAIRLLEDRA